VGGLSLCLSLADLLDLIEAGRGVVGGWSEGGLEGGRGVEAAIAAWRWTEWIEVGRWSMVVVAILEVCSSLCMPSGRG
jgi:hypothetical protein